MTQIDQLVQLYKIKVKAQMGEFQTVAQNYYEKVNHDLENYLEKLQNDEEHLQSIESHEDDILVFMHNIVQNVSDSLGEFSPQLDLANLNVKLKI